MVALQKRSASGFECDKNSQRHIELKNSGFANYFSRQDARSAVDHSNMRYRCEKFFSKRRLARFRNSGQMGKQLTETQNKRMKFGSPKSLIQADNGQKFGVGVRFVRFKNDLLGGKYVETNAIYISMCKSLYLHSH